jgi:hypothetical protein
MKREGAIGMIGVFALLEGQVFLFVSLWGGLLTGFRRWSIDGCCVFYHKNDATGHGRLTK